MSTKMRLKGKKARPCGRERFDRWMQHRNKVAERDFKNIMRASVGLPPMTLSMVLECKPLKDYQ